MDLTYLISLRNCSRSQAVRSGSSKLVTWMQNRLIRKWCDKYLDSLSHDKKKEEKKQQKTINGFVFSFLKENLAVKSTRAVHRLSGEEQKGHRNLFYQTIRLSTPNFRKIYPICWRKKYSSTMTMHQLTYPSSSRFTTYWYTLVYRDDIHGLWCDWVLP